MNITGIINNLNFEWFIFLAVFLTLILIYIFHQKISSTVYKMIVVGLFLSIIFIGLSLIPPDSFDLYRYYDEMKYYSTLEFGELIRLAFERPNFIWYMLLMILSVFKNTKLIFIVNLISFGIYIYYLFKYLSPKSSNYKQSIISILFFLSIINFIHTLSGLRNLLAISIFYVAFTCYLNDKKVFFLLLTTLALLIHPMVIILVIVLILSEILSKINKKNLAYLLLLIKPLSYVALFIISKIPIPIFKLYATKLNLELNGMFGVDYRILFLEVIQIILIFIYIYLMVKENKQFEKQDSKLINFSFCLLLCILGSIGMVNIFIRTRFMLAFIMPSLFYVQTKYIQVDYESKLNFENILMGISILINCYYIYYILCNGLFV